MNVSSEEAGLGRINSRAISKADNIPEPQKDIADAQYLREHLTSAHIMAVLFQLCIDEGSDIVFSFEKSLER